MVGPLASTVSTPSTPSPHSAEWGLISKVKMNDMYNVSKYRSTGTGMEVVHARVDGPHLHCFWIIAHKLENDFGLPHILQHLIWQGSKRYPASGLYPRIAGKCLSPEPTAWAERDHSCYHITTAGRQGFTSLLPVAFDHIFNPTLTEAAFMTEVYRVEGDGSDKGRCYEEIVHLEQDPEEICVYELIQATFGSESCYSFKNSGSSQILRNLECSIDTVKTFHDTFYHATNCCLVVVGDIVRDDLFSTLDPILDGLIRQNKIKLQIPVEVEQVKELNEEDELESEGDEEEKDNPSPRTLRISYIRWAKPWTNHPLIELDESRMRRAEYPSALSPTPRHGPVKVGILGPPSTEKLNRCVAMRLVLEYLASGPLQEAFKKKARASFRHTSISSLSPHETHLSVGVTVSEYPLKQSLFSIDFHSVPFDLINSVPVILRRTLETQVSPTDCEFNYPRMVQVVQNFYQTELDQMENHMSTHICHAVIPDFLYGDSDSDLMFDRRINSAYTIHHFINQPEKFWKHVMQVWFLDANWVTVGALASKLLQDKLDLEVKRRMEQRTTGDAHKETKKLAQRYKAAVKWMTKTPPLDIIDKFPFPDVSTIGSTRLSRQDNPVWAKDTLCNLYVDNITSNYAFLTVVMNTSELTLEERKYLVLFSEAVLQSPYVDNADVFHTAEDCALRRSRDVLKFETFFGLEWFGRLEDRTKFSCGSFGHLFCLRLQMDVTKVKEGFQWAQYLLWNIKWQADKLQHIALKLMHEVDNELKKEGAIMTRAMLIDSLYRLNSTPKCVSLIRQKSFLRRTVEELPKSMRRVSKMMEAIRMTILRPENVTVHVAANLHQLEFHLTDEPNSVKDAVAQLLRRTFDYTGWHWGYDTKHLANVPDTEWMRTADCIAKCSREQILRMNDTSVGYLIQAAPGIRSYMDVDYPYLLTAIQYLTQRQGPLHKVVEGGLAEDVAIRVSPTEGVIYFEMRACPDLATAYGKVFDCIVKHLDPAYQWDAGLLVEAKSSIIFKLTTEEDSPMHVGMSSLLAYYKGVPMTGYRKVMDAISKGTLAQVQAVAGKYFKPLFLQPCTCAASAPTDDAIPVIKNMMEHCGKRLALIPPVEQSALASYNQ